MFLGPSRPFITLSNRVIQLANEWQGMDILNSGPFWLRGGRPEVKEQGGQLLLTAAATVTFRHSLSLAVTWTTPLFNCGIFFFLAFPTDISSVSCSILHPTRRPS